VAAVVLPLQVVRDLVIAAVRVSAPADRQRVEPQHVDPDVLAEAAVRVGAVDALDVRAR